VRLAGLFFSLTRNFTRTPDKENAMMTAPAAPAMPKTVASVLHRVDIGEPIDAYVALARTPLDVLASLKALRGLAKTGWTLVLHLPTAVTETELLGLLDRATSIAERVVLTGLPETAARPGALSSHELRRACLGNWRSLIQIEPDPERAVIGTLHGLSAGNSFAVVWPADARLGTALDLVRQGAAWRSAWEVPDDGTFQRLAIG
jgi:hypothetical protein